MTTSLSMKKVALGAAGLAIVFSAAFASTARAATDADLQAQIQSLLAMIANLQAQLAGGTTSGSTSGSTTAMQFTLNHKQGDKGGEVMNIQKFLNMDPATMVAVSGPGSPGNETSYFGPATKAAVIKFQNKYASEILAPVGLSAGTGYWGQSTRAKANALEIARAAAAGTGTGTGTTTPTGSDLTVSAAAQPGNGLAVEDAANLPFTKFTLTAGATDMTVNSVTVELTGLATRGAFDSVVLLDENNNRVGLARSLNSNDQATIGETMTIPAGTSKTFTVAANMLTSALTNYAGQVAAFSVVAINTPATVTGALPITGAQHTINASLAIGSATYDEGANNPSAGKDFEIGSTGEIFASVEVDNTGSEEDIRVMSIRFYQKGSASASDLANLVVDVNGTSYPVTVSADGKYYTANFGSGIVLAEGKNEDFKLKGDVVSGSGRTMEFDIDEDTDITIVGETYGYGITPTDAFASNSLDITGGSFQSFSRDNNIAAANVTIEDADAILGGFKTVIEGEPITVKTMSFDVTITNAGGSKTPTVASITRAVLVDGNGSILAGPVDGSGAALTGTISFTNVTLPVGTTQLVVKGELSNNFETDDTIILNTNPNSADWDDVRGENTNDVIVVSGLSDVTAHTMTVKSASLVARNLAIPAAQKVVAGQTDFIWATAVLDAQDSGEDIEVSEVTVTVVTADEAAPADLDSVAIWTLKSDGTLDTRVTDTENLSGAAASTVSTAFSMNSNIIVPKGGNVEIAVVGNLASSVTSYASGTADTWTVDISAVDGEGATSNVTANVTSVGGTNGQVMTLAGSGTLTPAIDANSPVAGLITGGQEYILGVYEFAADDVENINLEKITVANTGTAAAVSTFNVYNGSTLVGSTPGGAAAVDVTLSGVVVPKDGKVDLTIKGLVAAIDGTTVQNEDTIVVDITKLEATGATSGTSLDDASVTVAAAATQKLVEVYPTVAIKDSGVSKDLLPSTQQLVAEIDFTAIGTQDLEFKQNVSGQLLLSVLGDIGATANITLKDGDGNTLQSSTAMVSNVLTATFAQKALTVAPGTTKTIRVYADTSALTTAGDVVYVRLLEAQAGLRYHIDGTQLTTGVGDIVFKGNIDGPTFVKP